MGSNSRFPSTELTSFTSRLFQACGLSSEKGDVTAKVLVEADLLGHTTHGLNLAAPYLKDLEAGKMNAEGDFMVIRDRGAVAVWDGRYLPGLWLTQKSIEDATAKAKTYGVGTVVIRKSHHIGCLASYLEAPARDGLLIEVSCVDPSVVAVPAHGGLNPIFTPDPIAVGIPTAGDPIMIDLSASTTAMGTAALYRQRGDLLPGNWLQDAEGTPTNDPNILVADEPGTILPTGGIDHGHKGYSLALILETFTQGLSGLGRIDQVNAWGAATQVRITDPEFFCGITEFRRQSQYIVDICKNSIPRDSEKPVRLPGQSGLARKRMNLEQGVPLSDSIISSLREWSDKLKTSFPQPKEFS